MKKNIMLRLYLSIVGLMLLFGCATTSGMKEASTATEEASSVEEIAVITGIAIEDANVVIKSNKDFIYTLYTGNDPYKVTIEIPGMSIGKFTEKIVSDKPVITEIIPQQINTPDAVAKIDIMLQSPSAVSPSYNDNTLALSIRKEEPVAEQPVVLSEIKEMESKDVQSQSQSAPLLAVNEKPPHVIKAAEENIQPATKATEISGVEIKKTADVVKVLITGNGTLIPNVFPVNERIVIDIPDVSLNTTLPDSGISPLKGIRAGKHKGKLRLVLDLKQKTNFDVHAIGNSIEISLLATETLVSQVSRAYNNSKKTVPASTASDVPAKSVQPAQEPEKLIEGEYSGKKISLDFQDADVRPIFRLLADVSGYNLVLHPDVKGNVTIKLLNVPWDQALDIMLNLNKPPLAKSIEGNILWIAPTNVLTQMAEEKQKAKDTGEKTEELVQEIIRVNYASSADISSAVTSGKLLTPRGNIAIDSRMNTIILKDTQKSIDKIKELVTIMDVPKPQVMIEAKIVEVSTNYSEALGIRWGGSFNVPNFPNILGGDFSVNTPTIPAGSGTENRGGAMNFTVGNASNIMVNMSLSALESIGKSKTLSNPRVLTMDKEAANIQQGRSFFVQTISTQGSVQTEEKKATLSLDVTPQITPDGYIQLKVVASDDSIESGSGNNTIVNTKKLSTNALIKSGETLVLGGIYTTSATENEDGVPVLSKIPGLGWLFKTRNMIGPDTKEMLIFLTPTIVARQL
jgi:type IV pilus secretin PilQ/predicted competence protein